MHSCAPIPGGLAMPLLHLHSPVGHNFRKMGTGQKKEGNDKQKIPDEDIMSIYELLSSIVGLKKIKNALTTISPVILKGCELMDYS